MFKQAQNSVFLLLSKSRCVRISRFNLQIDPKNHRSGQFQPDKVDF